MSEENKYKWTGSDNGVSCVSSWVDTEGAHLGLYADHRKGTPCDIALSARLDGQLLLQILVDGKPKIIDLKKLAERV